MLEMQITSPKPGQKFPDIKWNFEELKQDIQTAMADYQNLVVTPEAEKDFKDTRAKLNKLYTAIENARKDMKAKAMAPFLKFEAEVREVEEPIVSAIGNIDGQLKEIDQIRKDQKKADIAEAYRQYVEQHADFPDFLDFQRVWGIWNPNSKRETWLNKTCGMDTIISQIGETADQVNRSLKTLKALPEYSFEAIQYYKVTLNIDAAIQKAAEMAEIQRRKALEEAKKAEAEKTMLQAPQNGPQNGAEGPKTSEKEEDNKNITEAKKFDSGAVQAAQERSQERQYTFLFECTVTLSQAKALGDFCRDNGIKLVNKTK